MFRVYVEGLMYLDYFGISTTFVGTSLHGRSIMYVYIYTYIYISVYGLFGLEIFTGHIKVMYSGLLIKRYSSFVTSCFLSRLLLRGFPRVL